MGTGAEPKPTLLQRLSKRLENPLAWDEPTKILLILSLLIPTLIALLIRVPYIIENPEIEPYVSRAALEQGIVVMRGYVGLSLLLVIVGLLLRRARKKSRLYVYIATLSWWLLYAWAAYLVGITTSPLWVAFAMFGFLCLFLFERRVAVTGIVTGMVIIHATAIAERLGWIPYAPYFNAWPEVDGRLSNEWVISNMLWPTATLLAALSMFEFILARARAQAEQLAITSEQLSRANELISRYVAAQVTERILAGDYDSVNKHARRKLTIFFSDIKDFTATTERMEAEDLSQILNEYLSEMTRIAETHGGTIDKFVGDAIMIFFGAPDATSDEDHALRAVRMAVEMQARMETLRDEWRDRGHQLPFHVRMGINTGQASIGNFGSEGRMDYTAIGRQVNLAARLEVNCVPDRVLISHTTWSFVKDEIPCMPKGEIEAKGVRDPVKVYEVAPEAGFRAPLTER